MKQSLLFTISVLFLSVSAQAYDFEDAAVEIASDAYAVRTAGEGKLGVEGQVNRVEGLKTDRVDATRWYVAVSPYGGGLAQRYVFEVDKKFKLLRGTFKLLKQGEDAK